jgi:hypothetical protein
MDGSVVGGGRGVKASGRDMLLFLRQSASVINNWQLAASAILLLTLYFDTICVAFVDVVSTNECWSRVHVTSGLVVLNIARLCIRKGLLAPRNADFSS